MLPVSGLKTFIITDMTDHIKKRKSLSLLTWSIDGQEKRKILKYFIFLVQDNYTHKDHDL